MPSQALLAGEDVEILLWRRSRAAEAALGKLLRHPPSPEVHKRLLDALGDRRVFRPQVLAATRSPDASVRLAAYRALRSCTRRDEAVWRAIKRGMTDECARVRALTALHAVDLLTATHDLRSDPEIVTLGIEAVETTAVGIGAVILRLCGSRRALASLLGAYLSAGEPEASHLARAIVAVSRPSDRSRILGVAARAPHGELLRELVVAQRRAR